MLVFFELLYYYIFGWFSESNKEGAEGKACAAVTGLQVFNIYSIASIISVTANVNLDISKLFIVILFFAMLVFNYFRFVYFDARELAIKNNWESKTDSAKLNYKNLFQTYCFESYSFFRFGHIFCPKNQVV